MSGTFLGVDIGTGSARVLAVDDCGVILGSETTPLHISNPIHKGVSLYEQSSTQIWGAVCQCVDKLIKNKTIVPTEVKSIGFDATCSLVVLDSKGKPLSVTPSDSQGKDASDTVWDTIMWCDHRAMEEAEQITNSGHSLLQYVGNRISPENEPPKLLWLKKNLPSVWSSAGHFFDLADFLTYKSTGDLSRSFCTLLCKWLYQSNKESHQWDTEFYTKIGLGDLCEDNFKKIGSKVQMPGESVGCLTEESARELGLPTTVVVSSGLIDAHAGVVAVLATKLDSKEKGGFVDLTKCLPMIAGTSTCHFHLSKEPNFFKGITGPQYQNKMMVLGLNIHHGQTVRRLRESQIGWPIVLETPTHGIWINEGGQSAVGSTLDMILQTYGGKPGSLLFPNNVSVSECHAVVLDWIQQGETFTKHESMIETMKSVHVWPDYHGNRSPIGNLALRGAILGLELINFDEGSNQHMDYIAKLYLAHIQAFALQTRHIAEEFESKGTEFRAIYLCGGFQRNSVYVQAHADALQLPVIVPECSETVALGAAIIGATAYTEKFQTIYQAMEAFGSEGNIVHPNLKLKAFYERKYNIFGELGRLVVQEYDSST